MMAQHIKVGTQVDGGGAPLDVYVIERITKTADGYRITAHTLRQRAFGRNGGPAQTWTDTELTQQIGRGTIRILSYQGARRWHTEDC